jgi:hypothetical protein
VDDLVAAKRATHVPGHDQTMLWYQVVAIGHAPEWMLRSYSHEYVAAGRLTPPAFPQVRAIPCA